MATRAVDPRKFEKWRAMHRDQIAVRCWLEGGHGPWAILPAWTMDAGAVVCARCRHEENR